MMNEKFKVVMQKFSGKLAKVLNHKIIFFA